MKNTSPIFFPGSYLVWVSDDIRPPSHRGSVLWISREQCRNWQIFIRSTLARKAQTMGCQVACPNTNDPVLRAECRTLRKHMYPSSDQKLADIALELQLPWLSDELRTGKVTVSADFGSMIDAMDRRPPSQRNEEHEHNRWLFLALDLL